jgi:hypothetical protein
MLFRSIAAAAAFAVGSLAFTAPALAGGWNPDKGNGHGHHHKHHHHYNNGNAAAFGVLGLATGALLGAALAQPRPAPAPTPVADPSYGEWVAYCSRKYQTFDPATGLFFGDDGQYHACR